MVMGKGSLQMAPAQKGLKVTWTSGMNTFPEEHHLPTLICFVNYRILCSKETIS